MEIYVGEMTCWSEAGSISRVWIQSDTYPLYKQFDDADEEVLFSMITEHLKKSPERASLDRETNPKFRARLSRIIDQHNVAIGS